MLNYAEKQIKQIAREGNGAPIHKMCAGCCRAWIGQCLVITDPLHFYEDYGKCFAYMNAETAQEVETQLKAYSNRFKGSKMCKP